MKVLYVFLSILGDPHVREADPVPSFISAQRKTTPTCPATLLVSKVFELYYEKKKNITTE